MYEREPAPCQLNNEGIQVPTEGVLKLPHLQKQPTEEGLRGGSPKPQGCPAPLGGV